MASTGRSGQNLARMLDTQGIPYMALDLDRDRVRARLRRPARAWSTATLRGCRA